MTLSFLFFFSHSLTLILLSSSLTLLSSLFSLQLSLSLSIFWLWIGGAMDRVLQFGWYGFTIGLLAMGVLVVFLSWVCSSFAHRGFAMGFLAMRCGCACCGFACRGPWVCRRGFGFCSRWWRPWVAGFFFFFCCCCVCVLNVDSGLWVFVGCWWWWCQVCSVAMVDWWWWC